MLDILLMFHSEPTPLWETTRKKIDPADSQNGTRDTTAVHCNCFKPHFSKMRPALEPQALFDPTKCYATTRKRDTYTRKQRGQRATTKATKQERKTNPNDNTTARTLFSNTERIALKRCFAAILCIFTVSMSSSSTEPTAAMAAYQCFGGFLFSVASACPKHGRFGCCRVRQL